MLDVGFKLLPRDVLERLVFANDGLIEALLTEKKEFEVSNKKM